MAEQIAKELVRRLAHRQAGRVSRAQLLRCGISRGKIDGWIASGYLVPVLRGVYAVGHVAASSEGDLFGAVLYAGPKAMLSHRTAACWRGLIDDPPSAIHVSCARRCRSLPHVTVHDRRACERWLCRGMPVTSIPQTALDLAATSELLLVRRALGRLDFRGELDVDALAAICGSGRPGSVALQWALAHHDPRFGHTNGRFEENYLVFCEDYDVPKPDYVGYWLHGIKVDAYYVRAGVVIELDGSDNHKSWAQLKRDHHNDLTLRSHGLVVLRYVWDQVHARPLLVRDDILTTLAR
jgi:hypothetical protein